MRKNIPMYIAIEGQDCAGKTDLISRLSSEFEQRDIAHSLMREPGQTSVGKELRRLMLNNEMSRDSRLLLMMADRVQSMQEVVIPTLAEDKWILSDRCFLSTVAYQGAGEGVPQKLISLLHGHFLATAPDLILVLDVTIETAQKRMMARGAERDVIEENDPSFFGRVRRGYLQAASENPSTIYVVDANGSPNETFDGAMKVLEGYL